MGRGISAILFRVCRPWRVLWLSLLSVAPALWLRHQRPAWKEADTCSPGDVDGRTCDTLFWFATSRRCAGVKEEGASRPSSNLQETEPAVDTTLILPRMLLVGPPKSGSTETTWWLKLTGVAQTVRTNPEPCCGEEKFFFSQDHLFEKGLGHYSEHFFAPYVDTSLFVFDKTPQYFYHPLVPYRVAALMPEVQLVVTLRNPAKAAISLFKWNSKLIGRSVNNNTLAQFVSRSMDERSKHTACRDREYQRLMQCKQRWAKTSYTTWRTTPNTYGEMLAAGLTGAVPTSVLQYVDQLLFATCGSPASPGPHGKWAPYGSESFMGIYAYTEALSRWLALFPVERVLILFLESRKHDCASEFGRLCKFAARAASAAPVRIDPIQAKTACAPAKHQGATDQTPSLDPAIIKLLWEAAWAANSGIRELLRNLPNVTVPDKFFSGAPGLSRL
mmetsp:Transcript_13787/g.37751  ORF Transcript_13787/g.37751 Transcript_13787/m.37751 type:complete len:445 (-) Transcript_13787:313-1647(-)